MDPMATPEKRRQLLLDVVGDRVHGSALRLPRVVLDETCGGRAPLRKPVGPFHTRSPAASRAAGSTVGAVPGRPDPQGRFRATCPGPGRSIRVMTQRGTVVAT
jgi:hypothetical protein